MAALNLQIDIDRPNAMYGPGETLNGRATVTSPDGPWEADSMTLILFWRTSGIGTQDEGIAHSIDLCKKDEKIPSHFTKDFSLPLPVHPYTYFGQLVKITWHLGLYVKKGWLKNQEVELPLTIQPATGTVQSQLGSDTIFYGDDGVPLPNQPIM